MLTELKKVGIDVILFFSGMAGTYVLKRKDENFNFWRYVADMVAGGLTAMYLTPLFNDIMRLNHNGELGMAFAIGLLGYRAVDLIQNFIIKWFKNGSK